jgi:hypothetical protein
MKLLYSCIYCFTILTHYSSIFPSIVIFFKVGETSGLHLPTSSLSPDDSHIDHSWNLVPQKSCQKSLPPPRCASALWASMRDKAGKDIPVAHVQPRGLLHSSVVSSFNFYSLSKTPVKGPLEDPSFTQHLRLDLLGQGLDSFMYVTEFQISVGKREPS